MQAQAAASLLPLQRPLAAPLTLQSLHLSVRDAPGTLVTGDREQLLWQRTKSKLQVFIKKRALQDTTYTRLWPSTIGLKEK